MPSTRDIRRRIRSVKNTAQITKAMQMVASAKMRKAQQAAVAGRPYATLMNEVLAAVSAGVGDFSHPLMEKREVKKRAVILVSTDKGLCGALNTNLLRETAKFDRNSTAYVAAGRKASQYIARTRRELVAEFTYKDNPQFSEARAISKFAQELFLEGKVDAVEVLYTNFISTLNQKPEVRPLLPLGELKALDADVAGESKGAELKKSDVEYLFEPSANDVLGSLLPHYLNFQVYQFLLEAKASEHSSRMVAMKNATDNAKQLIKDLTLEYNKLRQANITRELLEITSAAMAMGSARELDGMTIHDIYRRISPLFRRKRMAWFFDFIKPESGATILDLGGLPWAWVDSGIKNKVVMVNITVPEGVDRYAPQFTMVKGDATALSFSDGSFGVVYSNSVIEHLGTWERQQRFASQARRIGRKIWVQTPSRWFPVEPHLIAPFIHFFPKRIQRHLIRHFTVWGWMTRPTRWQIEEFLDEVRLLNHREMVELFPDCRIIRERALGLTKSYIAVRA